MNDAVKGDSQHNKIGLSRFNGYNKVPETKPDMYLVQVGRGTPGGEYLRRFWHPVAYVSELGDVPLKVRALGEDLIVFKDKSDQVGLLHLHCSHRNTSLEYGIICDRGIRCCYHGRHFDIDGSVLDVPGANDVESINRASPQGAYPTHLFGGIVFAYMGPPDRIPCFPYFDRFNLPGLEIVPGIRWPVNCNWVQVQENALDPLHTATLHALPQLRGMDHFAIEFGELPDITWSETPGGLMYLATRYVNDKVWVRSTETLGANVRCISSIFEDAQQVKRASPPQLSLWSLPVDDDDSISFFVSHVSPNEPMSLEQRQKLESFGQTDERPYKERQFLPGDYEAMNSQGPINIHANENRFYMDRGVSMFRRYVRQNIEAVENGEDPHGFYLDQADVPPTFANDCVVPADTIGGDPNDPKALRKYSENLVKDYLASPPMVELGA